MISQDLKRLADPAKAKLLSGFFKTGKGQYGEGDIFLGITVPKTREVAKKNKDASLGEIKKSLNSRIHEERLCALLILVHKFEKANESEKKSLFNFYLSNSKQVNNWDLVDQTAPKIVGAYLFDKDKSLLYKLAKSHNLWERRIAMIATFHFIYYKQTKDAYKIAELLLDDKHDLMHKAVGWMLREAGKRVSQEEEEDFLKKHHKKMPRTALRYAIERFSAEKKAFYMRK